jgi:pimeloyl-ACP methyl ester carboxylesterase
VDLIDRGSGPPLVLIPGLQGRWEHLRPAVEALAASFRVLTFSLDEVGTEPAPPLDVAASSGPTTVGLHTDGHHGAGADPRVRPGLDRYADAAAAMMTAARIDRATICGVSFGGLIAVRFAARHASRCDALILASTPRPRLRLRPRHQFYLRAPWILGPIFLAETPFRLRAEILAAIPDRRARWRFVVRTLRMVVGAPVSLSRMAGRARMISAEDVGPDCARITAPTLVLTGERHLDHVVPVEGSSEYLRLIPHARAAVLERTGHLGSITRPDAFTAIVRGFTAEVGADPRVRPGPTQGSAPTGQVA